MTLVEYGQLCLQQKLKFVKCPLLDYDQHISFHKNFNSWQIYHGLHNKTEDRLYVSSYATPIRASRQPVYPQRKISVAIETRNLSQ